MIVTYSIGTKSFTYTGTYLYFKAPSNQAPLFDTNLASPPVIPCLVSEQAQSWIFKLPSVTDDFDEDPDLEFSTSNDL
jgi:hypothetical protein